MSEKIKDESLYLEDLRTQLVEAHEKVTYTYTAHHKIKDRLMNLDVGIRVTQIVLSAFSTVGFFSLVILNQTLLTWIGGISAVLSLGLNLYSKDAKLQVEAQKHKNAADDLWEIREEYVSLITDLNVLPLGDIREKRDTLSNRVSEINKKYPGTDKRGYEEAKRAIKNGEEQTFNIEEAEKLLPSNLKNRNVK